MSATMTVPTTLVTLEEFAARSHPTRLEELVRGRIVPMTLPTPRHGQICAKVVRLLGNFADDHGLGHVVGNDSGVITERDPDTLRGPDIAFYSYSRLAKGALPAGYLSVGPDLVVEVRSPGNRWSALYSKAGEYLDAGVSIVVVLDEETESASIFTNTGLTELSRAAELSLPEILPGFSVPVGRFFE
jgi:Uma2 family endonuclease